MPANIGLCIGEACLMHMCWRPALGYIRQCSIASHGTQSHGFRTCLLCVHVSQSSFNGLCVFLHQVILTGYPGSYPPIDPKGFLEFARSLPSQTIYNALHNGKIVSKISRYAKTGNFRRRFDKVSPPQGLCVIGDAACYFNPVNVCPVWPPYVCLCLPSKHLPL